MVFGLRGCVGGMNVPDPLTNKTVGNNGPIYSRVEWLVALVICVY